MAELPEVDADCVAFSPLRQIVRIVRRGRFPAIGASAEVSADVVRVRWHRRSLCRNLVPRWYKSSTDLLTQFVCCTAPTISVPAGWLLRTPLNPVALLAF